MKATIQLNTNKKTKEGHPVIFYYINNGIRKRINLGFYFDEMEWNFDKQLPFPSAKNYSFIYPKLVNYNYLIKQLLYNGETDLKKYTAIFKKEQVKTADFYAYAAELISALERKHKFANAKYYTGVIAQFKKVHPVMSFADLNYTALRDFKIHKLSIPTTNSTVHAYLRTLRAIYNEAVLNEVIEDLKPFKNIFKDIAVRKNRTKKKYLSIESVRRLELPVPFKLSETMIFMRDLFLLQFYFGGQDLIDIYHLQEKQLKNGRVYFTREKLGERGYEFDLAITDKAAEILKKYKGADGYLLPGRKDFKGYMTFRRRYQRYLVDLQTILNIDVLPLNTNLGVKVARYTFANRGKKLGINEDLLRELMGHERTDVDTIYKDKHPQEARDLAHLKIITTSYPPQ
jgi:integrase